MDKIIFIIIIKIAFNWKFILRKNHMYTLHVQNDRTLLDFWFTNIIQYIKILYIYHFFSNLWNGQQILKKKNLFLDIFFFLIIYMKNRDKLIEY